MAVRAWFSVSVLLVASALPICAQQQPNAVVPLGRVRKQTMVLRAHVPFPFVVGNQTLPAGIYQVERLMGKPAEGDQVGIIVLRGADSPIYKALVTNLASPPLALSGGASQLVFERHEGTAYLSEVQIAGEKKHQISTANPESERAQLERSQEQVGLAELR